MEGTDTVSLADADYRAIAEAAPDALLLVGPDGAIRFANGRAEELFGYVRGRLEGERLEVLIPERLRAAHEAQTESYLRAAEPAARPMGKREGLAGRRADGSEVRLEISLSPVRTREGTCVCACLRDVTAREALEAEARRGAERLARAVALFPDAFAVFDAGDRLVVANERYLAMLVERGVTAREGAAFAELLGQLIHTARFASESDRAAFERERLAERGLGASRFEVHTAQGRALRVTNERTADGGTVQTIRDVTDRRRFEGELIEARAAAEAAGAAKSEFLGSMSHELRTPLNAILGFGQLLERDRREPLSEAQRRRVGHVLRGGEQLLGLVDDVLDLARSDALRGMVSLSPPAAVSPRLVLYVEDNPANVALVRELLSGDEGIEFLSAPSAELGLALAARRRPDVLLTDIHLPGASGVDVLEALRARPETSRVPVIALTASASPRERALGERAGFFRYLTKPVRADELRDAITAALRAGG